MEAAGGIVGVVLVVIALIITAVWVLFPLLALGKMDRMIKELKRGNDLNEKTAWYAEQAARVAATRTEPPLEAEPVLYSDGR
jgi:hypothetical protein